MEKIVIAAIITAYNRPKIVLEALESVARQVRPPDRLVVVDDGSVNETPDNIERWIESRATDFEIELVRQENRGLAAARNRGVAEAGACDVIAFLDDDDLWPEDYLRRVERAMADHPRAVAACTDRRDIDLTRRRTTFARLDRIGEQTTRRLLMDGPTGPSNTVFRAAAFHAVGGFDPDLRNAEDYQVMLRLSMKGPWVHAPGQPVTRRRGSADAAGNAPQLSKRYADRRLILARVLDRFVTEDGGREVIPERLWRRRVGRLWYTAGRQLRKLDRREEAAACFKRAVRLQPWHLRARLRTLLG